MADIPEDHDWRLKVAAAEVLAVLRLYSNRAPALLILDVAREIILADLPTAQAAMKRDAEEQKARSESA